MPRENSFLIPVGDALLGRVVNALCQPVDGGANVEANTFRWIETDAPGIAQRQPVKKPLQTGIKSIDSMIPIGRGQRELIIGDRKTGKTSIALDTIINQKDKNVICIYVAIGQKESTIAEIVDTLKRYNAMDYTTVIVASAADSALCSISHLIPAAPSPSILCMKSIAIPSAFMTI